MSTRRPLRYRGWRRPRTYADTRPTGRQGLSGWWRRVGAAALDTVVILVPVVVVAVVTGGYRITRSPQSGRLVAHVSVAYVVANAVLWLVYVTVCLCRSGDHNGQTLGKEVLGITVVRNDRQPIALGTVAIREVLCKSAPSYVASVLGPVGVVLVLAVCLDYLWPLWDPENRALHDHVAKTRVVRAPRP
jgi:uncharacterized RDD family membrane protein YckC